MDKLDLTKLLKEMPFSTGQISNQKVSKRSSPEAVREAFKDAPILPATLHDIVDYPASDENNGSMMLSTRVPISWGGLLDELRQTPNTPLPDIFKTKGRFVRWSVMQGIQILRQMINDAAETDPNVKRVDDLIEAQLFAERTAGRLAVRADVIKEALQAAESISMAVNWAINNKEYAEAASIITNYMDMLHTSVTNRFWKYTFVKTLVNDYQLRESLVLLVTEGHVDDQYLIEVLSKEGLFAEGTDTP